MAPPDRVAGRLFIAHNARCDHGYLRAAFRRVGTDLRPQVLRTLEPSRRRFAGHHRPGLAHRPGAAHGTRDADVASLRPAPTPIPTPVHPAEE